MLPFFGSAKKQESTPTASSPESNDGEGDFHGLDSGDDNV
jgi:hypothetical protein